MKNEDFLWIDVALSRCILHTIRCTPYRVQQKYPFATQLESVTWRLTLGVGHLESIKKENKNQSSGASLIRESCSQIPTQTLREVDTRGPRPKLLRNRASSHVKPSALISNSNYDIKRRLEWPETSGFSRYISEVACRGGCEQQDQLWRLVGYHYPI